MKADTATVNQAIPLWNIVQSDTNLTRQAATNGGEYHGPCPFCGGTDRFVIQRNRGGNTLWLCRQCTGAKWQDAIAYLMRRDNRTFQEIVSEYEWYQPPVRQRAEPVRKPSEARQKPQWWHMTISDYLSRYAASAETWQAYKPVTPQMVSRYHLGYGVLPAPTQCKCPRLLLPIFDREGRLTCIRGRLAGECHCTDSPKKWLASGGFSLSELPLFNNQKAGIVVILENPIDAIMMTENQVQAARWLLAGMPHLQERMRKAMMTAIADNYAPITAVATLSIYYWRPEWALNASMSVVAFDNDLPGNGGADRRNELIQQYREERPDRPLPEPRGTALASKVGAYLYNWHGFEGKDYGDWVAMLDN